MPKKVLGWHFTAGHTLANGDDREIMVGKTLTLKDKVKIPGDIGGSLVVTRKIDPCYYGLHLSENILDALRYAPGPILWRVEGSGEIVPNGDPIDKYACSRRRAIAGGKDASELLRVFARQCALDVIHLWKAPDIVREYLLTGDESKRGAARAVAAGAWNSGKLHASRAAWDAAGEDTAWDAAWATARAAARAAAGAAAGAAAIRAAGEAVWDAAWASGGLHAERAAWAAAWAAALDTAGNAQSKRLELWACEFIESGVIPECRMTSKD